MSDSMAVLAIIVGIVFVVIGIAVKQFYAASGIAGAPGGGKLQKRWQGRAIFVGVGVVFFCAGLAHFFAAQ